MPPDRIPYIQFKKQEGWKIFGVLPGHYPRELLLAAKVLPVEIWDPKVDLSLSHGHIQPTICGIVKSVLAFLLKIPQGLLDGLVVPHTCDSLQNLGSLIKDLFPQNRLPCVFFYPPKGPFKKSSADFYKRIVRRFEEDLRRMGLVVDRDALNRWCNKTGKLFEKWDNLFEITPKKGFLKFNSALSDLIRANGYLIPDDMISEIDHFKSALDLEEKETIYMMVSGIHPYQKDFMDLLDATNAKIVEDDSLFLRRRIPMSLYKSSDPYEELTYRYFSLPPCPTRGISIKDRIDYLFDKAQRQKVSAIVFSTIKFCEPEYFDIPILCSALKEKGLKILHIETEYTNELGIANMTRVEAFLEGLSNV